MKISFISGYSITVAAGAGAGAGMFTCGAGFVDNVPSGIFKRGGRAPADGVCCGVAGVGVD